MSSFASPLQIAAVVAAVAWPFAAGLAVVLWSKARAAARARREDTLDGDLQGMFRGQSDVVIQNGDVVYVDRAPMIYIYGEVQRPGAFRLERDMTVLQSLAAGGGLTQRGTERGMRVHRRGPDGKVQVIQPSMDDRLRDGDVVYVRESLF